MASPQTHELTIHQAAAALRAGRISSPELLDACLARIDELDGKIKAWVTVDREGARRAARVAEKSGSSTRGQGVLYGIPVAVKDIFDVAGMTTRAGSRVLEESAVKTADAASVARLRAAGAVILGKTVTTEFAFTDPAATTNPWNQTHTPGGSSSGSAAAVAAGMCLGAIGTQTGGSTIRPAAYCGIVGFKPSYDLIDRAGLIALSNSLDHVGIFGRSVDDAAIMLGVLAGRPYEFAAVREASEIARPLRLRWLTGYFTDRCSTETARNMEQVSRRLSAAGATILQTAPPAGVDQLVEVFMTIVAAEAAFNHRQWYSERRAFYGRNIGELLERGHGTLADDYLDACANRRAFIAATDALLSDCDALILPSTPAPAPEGLSSTGDFTFNSPWTMAGVPVIGFPTGLASGLPLGLQMIGRRGDDMDLLAAARWCERIVDVRLVAPC